MDEAKQLFSDVVSDVEDLFKRKRGDGPISSLQIISLINSFHLDYLTSVYINSGNISLPLDSICSYYTPLDNITIISVAPHSQANGILSCISL